MTTKKLKSDTWGELSWGVWGTWFGLVFLDITGVQVLVCGPSNVPFTGPFTLLQNLPAHLDCEDLGLLGLHCSSLKGRQQQLLGTMCTQDQFNVVWFPRECKCCFSFTWLKNMGSGRFILSHKVIWSIWLGVRWRLIPTTCVSKRMSTHAWSEAAYKTFLYIIYILYI